MAMKVEQRRRLTDLYANGEEVTLGEGADAQQVWVRRMTPADAEIAYLKANARRASVKAQAKEAEPSDFYVAIRAEVEAFNKEQLVDWLVEREMVDRFPVVQAEVAGRPDSEWAKEKYIDSIKERFADDDFQERMLEVPDDPEVKRVLSELARFHKEVAVAQELEKEIITSDFNLDQPEDLRERVVEKILETQGEAAWLQEFYNCQIWRCVFWSDTREPVFASRAEVDEIQAQVNNELRAVIERIHVPDAEGKD